MVVRLAEPPTTAEGSLWTKPVMVAANAGRGAPYTLPALFAVTVSVALFTLTPVVLELPAWLASGTYVAWMVWPPAARVAVVAAWPMPFSASPLARVVAVVVSVKVTVPAVTANPPEVTVAVKVCAVP